MKNGQGHILVVDDYAMNRLKLSHFLQQQGHVVTSAEHGKQALELLNKHAFDLMLLDIEMPEANGYEVLEYMKQQDILRNLPVIVISASDEMERTITCIEMGAEDYLSKPFDPVLLNARLRACLEKKRLRDHELDYLQNVALVTKAAATVETNTFEPESLTDVALRQDELGRLARVFTNMVREVQAREEQLQSLNQAKTKMIDHLSHELKTPLAIISTSVRLLYKFFRRQNEARFLTTLERIQHYMKRLMELETEANDIAENKYFFHEHAILENVIRQNQDFLSTLSEERDVSDSFVDELRHRIKTLYLPDDDTEKALPLQSWVPTLLNAIQPLHAHRAVRVELDLPPSPSLRMRESLLKKAVCGLVRNAIENTPDGGMIRISLSQAETGLCLAVQDFGVGIDEPFQTQLFHGFIHAVDTKDYSSGTPYEFGAGGQGLDLLRTKLYAERLGFRIRVESRRCPYIQAGGSCPGDIKVCPFCTGGTSCLESGGSLFALEFPDSMLISSAEQVNEGGDI